MASPGQHVHGLMLGGKVVGDVLPNPAGSFCLLGLSPEIEAERCLKRFTQRK